MPNTLLIRHNGIQDDEHYFNGEALPFIVSKFRIEIFAEEFQMVMYGGARGRKVPWDAITVQVGIGGAIETFVSKTALIARLRALYYTGLFEFTVLANATDLISSDADNAIVLGTDGKLYVATSTGGSVNSVTGTTVDNTDPQNPIVNVPTFDEVLTAGNQSLRDAKIGSLFLKNHEDDFSWKISAYEDTDDDLLKIENQIFRQYIELGADGSEFRFGNRPEASDFSLILKNQAGDKIIVYSGVPNGTYNAIVSVAGVQADSDGDVDLSGAGLGDASGDGITITDGVVDVENLVAVELRVYPAAFPDGLLRVNDTGVILGDKTNDGASILVNSVDDTLELAAPNGMTLDGDLTVTGKVSADNIINELIYKANITQTTVTINSGLLVIGQDYQIAGYSIGDDFTNVGAASNTIGVVFTATGTTPADWSGFSVLLDYTASAPVATGANDTFGGVVLKYIEPLHYQVYKTGAFPADKTFTYINPNTTLAINDALIYGGTGDAVDIYVLTDDNSLAYNSILITVKL